MLLPENINANQVYLSTNFGEGGYRGTQNRKNNLNKAPKGAIECPRVFSGSAMRVRYLGWEWKRWSGISLVFSNPGAQDRSSANSQEKMASFREGLSEEIK